MTAYQPEGLLGKWNPRLYLTGAAFLWFLLWAGINTGPWNLDLTYIASGWKGLFNGVRAAFPLAMLVVWLMNPMRGRTRRRNLSLPEALWLWYMVVCLISSVNTKVDGPWFSWGYWGLSYLGTFAAVDIYMQGSESFSRAGELNRLSWLFCSAVLLTVVFVARGQLLAKTSMGVSGYGVLNRMPTVAGMVMVRANGISRMAAIPAIVAFVGFWEGRGLRRLLWLAVFVSCFYLVWVMQCRGSTSSLAMAMAVVMILLDGRARRLGWTLIAAAILIYIGGFVPDDTIHHYYRYATRGQQGKRLESMSGRDRIFRVTLDKITEAPFLGYGPQADRQFLEIGNAQNGPLYALLCGGVIGGVGYVSGLLLSWIMLIQALRWRSLLGDSERKTLLIVTGVMAFLTMRNIPENCAALYSVDLLLQLPALVYIGELNRVLKLANETVWARHSTQTEIAEPAAAYTASVRA